MILFDRSGLVLNFSSGSVAHHFPKSFNIHSWNHFALVFNSSGESNNGSTLCYFNGISRPPNYWRNGPGLKGQTTAFGKVTIGNHHLNVPPEHFNGSLKKLKVYNKILSSVQIKSSATNKNPQEPCPQDSVLYLPMNRYNKTV